MSSPRGPAVAVITTLPDRTGMLPSPFSIHHTQTPFYYTCGACRCDWPVDLWTSPADRPEPYGTYGQVMINIPVDHNLPTLSGLSPTGSTGFQQQAFQRQKRKYLRTSAHLLGQVF